MSTLRPTAPRIVAGVDHGGAAINYTLDKQAGAVPGRGIVRHPARSIEGRRFVSSRSRMDSRIAVEKAGVRLSDVAVVGLDTPGPASATGVLSAKGSTNFVHAHWCEFDIRANLEAKLGRPVLYLNDGNAGALWGHFAIFGARSQDTSLSAIIGTDSAGASSREATW